jgi:hypothetical protein
VNREQRGFALGFAVAALAVIFQVAGLAIHLTVEEHRGQRCTSSACAIPIANPLEGVPSGARLAEADVTHSSLKCLICQALQKLRPDTQLLSIPTVGPSPLSDTFDHWVTVDRPFVVSLANDSPRGPPSFLA